MTDEQQNQLANALHRATLFTIEEWRMIHNALSTYQNMFASLKYSTYASKREKLQLLMDKIRDNCIDASAREVGSAGSPRCVG